MRKVSQSAFFHGHQVSLRLLDEGVYFEEHVLVHLFDSGQRDGVPQLQPKQFSGHVCQDYSLFAEQR